MLHIELIDNNLLRIVDEELVIEIPVKIVGGSNCAVCSFSNCCFNNYDNLYPCAQIMSILSDAGYKNINTVFDVSKEELGAAGNLILKIFSNKGRVIKKKTIFRRRLK